MLGRARGATRWELNQGQSQWGRDWPPRKAAERRPARHPCDLDLSCHLWKRLSEEAPGVPPLRHLLQIGPELVAGSGSTRRLGHCSGTFAEEPRGELRFWPPGGEAESSLARPLPHGMPTSSWPGSTLCLEALPTSHLAKLLLLLGLDAGPMLCPCGSWLAVVLLPSHTSAEPVTASWACSC